MYRNLNVAIGLYRLRASQYIDFDSLSKRSQLLSSFHDSWNALVFCVLIFLFVCYDSFSSKGRFKVKDAMLATVETKWLLPFL